jgi:hypothetical protein
MIFQMATIQMNWRIIELYVEISSIGNAGDSLNNLPESSNRTENIIPSTINLAHQIHESDPQRFIYPTPVGPNITDEREQNDCDEGDDVRFKEGMLSIRQQHSNGYKFLLIVGTTVDQNGKEKKLQVDGLSAKIKVIIGEL